MRILFGIAAALTLGACGDVADTAANLSAKADAAIDEKAAVEAVSSAVDVEAAKAQAEAAARQAVREALPTGELAAIGAVVDEGALVAGIDKAVDGQSVRNAVGDAITGRETQRTEKPAE